MRLFLSLSLVAVFLCGLGTHAVSVETFARLLQSSDATASDNDAEKPSHSTAPMTMPTPASNATTSAPKATPTNTPAPVSSNATSSSSGGSTQSTGASGNDSSGGGKHSTKNDYGSYAAPIAAPTTKPKKNPGGSFMAPVASPSSADASETHTATAMDDDDSGNATSTGGSSTPGNSEPLAHHVYQTTSSNSTIILPEGQQPKHWPQFIFILFVLATIVLCGISARKSCSKRRNYEEVPTTLIV